MTTQVYNPDDIAHMTTPELNDLIHRLSIESAIREATRRSREEMGCPAPSVEETIILPDYSRSRFTFPIQNAQEDS